MYKYFGIIKYLGLIFTGRNNKYITSKITKERFLPLWQYAYFNKNENLLASQDYLFRIRPLLTLLNTRYQYILTPGKEVVIKQ